MAKSKQNRRAKNRIDGSAEGAMIKVDSGSESAIAIYRSSGVQTARASMFSAELEYAIDVIARERVFGDMLARRTRTSLLNGPSDAGPAVNRLQ